MTKKEFQNHINDKNEKEFNKKIKTFINKISVEYALSISNVLSSRQVFSQNLVRTKLFEMNLST